jgi:hypothetical protein
MPDFKPYAVVSYPGFFEGRNISVDKAKKTYGTKEEWQGKGDAYRHVVWQALMAKKYGDTAANLMGQYHELPLSQFLGAAAFDQTDEEKAMDLYNNELGRKIAAQAKSPEDIYRLAKKAVDKGQAKFIPMAVIEARSRQKEIEDAKEEQSAY